jgi:hypothetical protein
MRTTPQFRSVSIAKAVSDYRAIRAVPDSVRRLLDTIANQIASTMLSEVDYPWAENWIRAMKLEKQRAPGTIRKEGRAVSRPRLGRERVTGAATLPRAAISVQRAESKRIATRDS